MISQYDVVVKRANLVTESMRLFWKLMAKGMLRLCLCDKTENYTAMVNIDSSTIKYIHCLLLCCPINDHCIQNGFV